MELVLVPGPSWASLLSMVAGAQTSLPRAKSRYPRSRELLPAGRPKHRGRWCVQLGFEKVFFCRGRAGAWLTPTDDNLQLVFRKRTFTSLEDVSPRAAADGEVPVRDSEPGRDLLADSELPQA